VQVSTLAVAGATVTDTLFDDDDPQATAARHGKRTRTATTRIPILSGAG
jgi:hypothetical protein